MIRYINHVSGSFLNSFDNYRQQWIDTYIYQRPFEWNIHTDFWKDYEKKFCDTLNVWEEWPLAYIQQSPFDTTICWYKVIWFFDLENENEIIEIKTKSWRYSENDIKKNRQFNIYSYVASNKWKVLKLHTYNKKQDKTKVQIIDSISKEDFENKFVEKIKEIQLFLFDYNIVINARQD